MGAGGSEVNRQVRIIAVSGQVGRTLCDGLRKQQHSVLNGTCFQ
jgi:hypothetical protein